MPSSLQASIWPCSSASRENSEYSIWSEASGCTALPRLSDLAEHSESEMKRVLPSLTSSAIPPTLSSIGTFGSTRDRQNTSSVSIPRFFKLCSQVCRKYLGSLPLRAASGLPSRGLPLFE